MNTHESFPDDTARNFREDLQHRDDADDNTDNSQPRELSDKELGGIIAGIDPRIAHDRARQATDIDYPGAELDPDFKPPEHPSGH